MSGDERKLLDASGDYRYAVREGEPVADTQWQTCRLVLTNERLVLATSDGKRTVPLGAIALLDEADLPNAVDADGATPLSVSENVLLLDVADVADFDREYCRATLHGEVILANSPAVVGGVVQDDAAWGKARFRLEDDAITLEFPDGANVSFAVDDVGTVETTQKTVLDETRTVLEVEHTDDGDRSVESHLTGLDRHTRALESLFESVIESRDGDYELSDVENQVLMALYSGVSPFEMADFVGLSVDEVEEIYQHLLDVGAVDAVRTRTEVTLNAQGRNMASEAMNEQ